MANSKEKLFSEFAPTTTEAWKEKAVADLKGADYEKKLVWKTNEGFAIQPFYRREDIASLATTNALPGEYPFVRGNKKDNNEWCVRQDLNERSNRYMVVQDPVKLTITNWEPGKVEWFDAPLNPADPEGPSRKVPFTGEVYIERNDFMEEPPKKYFRLKPDGEVRLKYTYIIKCQEVVKDAEGNIVEIKCTYDPTSKPGAGEWRSVKGTIHWVSTEHAKEIELRLYDKLFTEAQMGQIPEGEDYKNYLNPESLVLAKGYAEPALLEDNSGIAVQFERVGYFFKDPDSTPEKFVFNKTTALKDSFKF